jgi:hypothetical protein
MQTLRPFRAATLLCATLLAVSAHASQSADPAGVQAPQCDATAGDTVTTLYQLPPQVLELLRLAKGGTEGIADIGGKFNPSDVIIDASIPMRRLLGGAIGRSCITLNVEYGGIGHYQKTLEYRLRENGWVQVKGAGIERAPAAPPIPDRRSN